MDVFKLSYLVGIDPTPRELLLDVLARRWTARAVVQTIIKHEFPDASLPPMPARHWKVELVLGQLGIHDLTCTYVNHDGPNWTGHVTESGIVISTGLTGTLK